MRKIPINYATENGIPIKSDQSNKNDPIVVDEYATDGNGENNVIWRKSFGSKKDAFYRDSILIQ